MSASPRVSTFHPVMLVLGFLSVSAMSFSQDHVATEVVKNSMDAVVLLVVSDPTGKDVALGSGFIVSSDGRVVTNFHVVKDAKRAIAKMANGAYFPVESVLATDPDRDLALIKLPGRNLPFLSLADSDKLAIGEHVFAIGSPLGLQNTVSDGIVSAVREEKAGTDWIQTTAPASPGNSGGPLLRNDGSVVGVITWGARMGQNLNFAAPANEVKALLSSADQPPRPLAPLRSNSTDESAVKRLKDVKKIAVGSFGNTEAANLVKEKMTNRLIASGKIIIVEDSSDADAVLAGIVGADIYGRADTAALRLTTKDGRSLWGDETSGRGLGRSASSTVADRLAKKLISAMAKD